MKILLLGTLTLLLHATSFSQKIDIAKMAMVQKILSADDMQGRKTFTAGADKAATFIAQEFTAAGIKPMPGNKDFFQKFGQVKTKFISGKATLENSELGNDEVIAYATDSSLTFTQNSPHAMVQLNGATDLRRELYKYFLQNQPVVLLVPTAQRKSFAKLKNFKPALAMDQAPVLVLLTDEQPKKFTIEVKQEVQTLPLQNVIGYLPGKTIPGEYVVFSGHYDHLGIGKPVDGDSIYNGANDDASGIAAVISLADYFKKLKNNARSIIFVAFTAEEIGGFGSQHFSSKVDPDAVVAMFNIEMIGTTSKWGTNSAYITGYERSDFGTILQKNLQGSNFTFHPDPYTTQNLFYRSDNATLAAVGVPAHTISTSKMDEEKTYHTVKDDYESIDLTNMAAIVEAIAMSSKGIIAGTDTPVRIEKMKSD